MSKKREARRAAIESGVRNAVDTVLVDKAMSLDEAFDSLEAFAGDGLSCYGFGDRLTAAEKRYAREFWAGLTFQLVHEETKR